MNVPPILKHPRRQHGGAALEFALVLPILVLMLYGIIVFGSMFYTQLVLSRAAEDGARSVSFLTSATTVATIPTTAQTAIKNEVINSLANSSIVPGNAGGYAARRTWLVNNVLANVVVDNASCGGGAVAANTLRIRFTFPYSAARIVAPIRLPLVGDFASWMPNTLSACANVQL